MASKKKAAKKPARKVGRPREDVPEKIGEQVAEWIASGKTLSAFCRQKGMPDRRTVNRWRLKDEEFSSRIARAREAGHDEIAEKLLELVRDFDGDALALQRLKLEIDTTLRLLAKWDSGRYGDKQKVEHEGTVTLAGLVEASFKDHDATE